METNENLSPTECISVVKDYFNKYLTNLQLTKDGDYTGWWWLWYIDEAGTKIFIDGDYGGHFYIKIFIEDTEYALWQFDKSVNAATKSTKKNIVFQLDILKRFLSEGR